MTNVRWQARFTAIVASFVLAAAVGYDYGKRYARRELASRAKDRV